MWKANRTVANRIKLFRHILYDHRNCVQPRTRSLDGRLLANLASCLESSWFRSFPSPLYNWLHKRGLIRHRICVCVGQQHTVKPRDWLVNELCSMRLPAQSRLPLRTIAVAQQSYVQWCPNHSSADVRYVIKSFYWISQSSTELRHFFRTFLLRRRSLPFEVAKQMITV